MATSAGSRPAVTPTSACSTTLPSLGPPPSSHAAGSSPPAAGCSRAWPSPRGRATSPRPKPRFPAAGREGELRAALVARGYSHHEPLFTLFFLSADFLPAVRLTPRGVWDVRQSRLLLPSRRLSLGPRAPRQPRVA